MVVRPAIKAIELKVNAHGTGVIQTTTNDHRFNHNASKNTVNTSPDKNVNNILLANGEFEMVDGELVKRLKVSRDAIRHALYLNEMACHHLAVQANDITRRKFISSMAALGRGYMFTSNGTKRTSVFQVTDAVSQNPLKTTLDPHVMRMQKKSKESIDDKSEANFYFREGVGATTYTFTGVFGDLSELGFCSLSEFCDRQSITDEDVGEVIPMIEKNFGEGSVRPVGFYVKNSDVYGIPERGFILNNAQKKKLVIDILRRIATLCITRPNGIFKVKSLEVNLITDCLNSCDAPDWKVVRDVNSTSLDFSMFDGVEFADEYTEIDMDVADRFYSDLLRDQKNAEVVADMKKNKKKKATSTDTDVVA